MNFSVKFNMKTPLCMGSPFIMGDGLIAHLEMRDKHGTDYFLLPSKKVVELDVTIPLDTFHDIYKASVSVFEDPHITTTTFYKRFPQKELATADTGRKARIDISRGSYKNYVLQMPLVVTRSVTFYFSGDMERVSYLVQHVKYLGKKTSIGYGEIKSFSVKESEDYSLIKDGMAMRYIPIEYLSMTTQRMNAPCKPPFWDRRNVRLCCVPFSEVRL